jgi:hypothetical protein
LKGLNDIQRYVKTFCNLLQKFEWWRGVRIQELPDLQLAFGSCDAKRLCDQFVFAIGCARWQIETAQARADVPWVHRDAKISGLCPGVGDPPWKARLYGASGTG